MAVVEDSPTAAQARVREEPSLMYLNNLTAEESTVTAEEVC